MIHMSPAVMEGFITHDAVLNKTRTGKHILTFQIAVKYYSYPLPDPPLVTFIHVEAWEKTAIETEKQALKGKRVQVRGFLEQDRWEADLGNVCQRIKIVADEIKFME